MTNSQKIKNIINELKSQFNIEASFDWVAITLRKCNGNEFLAYMDILQNYGAE